jgi:hypothetical protein
MGLLEFAEFLGLKSVFNQKLQYKLTEEYFNRIQQEAKKKSSNK